MPPKGAKGKAGKGADKAKAKPATPPPAGSVEDLAKQLDVVRAQLEQEQKDRSFMQLERDKLQQFWDISKAQLEDCQAELRQKDREAEEQTERHEVELKAFKQKIKHLLYEHGNHVEALKAQADAATKVASDDFNACEAQLMADKRALQSQLREQEAEFQAVSQATVMDNGRRETKLRAELVAEAAALSAKHDHQMAAVREAASLQSRQEQHAIEERLHAHVQALQQQHEKAFADMRAYFNGVVRDNLDAVLVLKAELAEHKHKEAAAASLLQEAASENQRLAEPLAKARKELAELQKAAALHTREAASLTLTRRRLTEAESRADQLQFENEVWQQRLALEQQERASLQQHFDDTVSGFQQSAVATAMLLDGMQTGKSPLNDQVDNRIPDREISAHWSRASLGNKRVNQSKSAGGHVSAEASKQQRSFSSGASHPELQVQAIRPPIPGLAH